MNNLGDVRILLWQKWKRFKYEAKYWLRSLGYDVSDRSFSNRSYGIYLLLFVAFWLYAMWLYVLDRFVDIGGFFGATTRLQLIDLVPIVVLIAQAGTVFVALRSSPLKLTTNDGTYVASSPVARQAITLTRFIQAYYGRIVVITPPLMIIAIGLTWKISPDVGGRAGFQAMFVAPLLVLCIWGITWCVGLMRLRLEHENWLLMIAFAVLAVPLAIIPGMMLRSVMTGDLSLIFVGLSITLAVALVYGVAYLGGFVNMVRVVEESQMFARINDLGPVGMMITPQVILDLQKGDQLATGKRLPLPNALGGWALLMRAVFAYLSFRRRDLYYVAAWGAVVALLLTLTQTIDGISPLQSWAGIILLVVIFPPRPVVKIFAEDQQHPFIRQFIPQTDLMLLLVDSSVPLITLTLVGGLVWWLRIGTIDGIAGIGLMTLLLTLCMGVDYVRPYNTGWRVSYTQAAAVSFAVSIGAGLALGSFYVAVVSALIFVAMLSLYLGA
ncbi:MAG: hypothetical protein RLP44_04100 [Aggregatilineales bacterium]